MKTTAESNGFIVSYDYSPKIHKAVFDKLMKDYFLKLEAFSGESIMQNDDSQIEAPQILAEIADNVIKFEVDYNDN